MFRVIFVGVVLFCVVTTASADNCTSEDFGKLMYMDVNAEYVCGAGVHIDPLTCLADAPGYLNRSCAASYASAFNTTVATKCNQCGSMAVNCTNLIAAASAQAVAAQLVTAGDGPCGNADDLAAIANANFSLINDCSFDTPRSGGTCLASVAGTSTECRTCMESQVPRLTAACESCSLNLTSIDCMSCVGQAGMMSAMAVCAVATDCGSDDMARLALMDIDAQYTCESGSPLTGSTCLTNHTLANVTRGCAIRIVGAKDIAYLSECTEACDGNPVQCANCHGAAAARAVAVQISAGDGPCGNSDDLTAIASTNVALVSACGESTPNSVGSCLAQVASTSDSCSECLDVRTPPIVTACRGCASNVTSAECMDCVAKGGMMNLMASCATVSTCDFIDVFGLTYMDIDSQYECDPGFTRIPTGCLVTSGHLTESCATLITTLQSAYAEQCTDCPSDSPRCTNCFGAASVKSLAEQFPIGVGPCGNRPDLEAIVNANLSLVSGCGGADANLGGSCLLEVANASPACQTCMGSLQLTLLNSCSGCAYNHSSPDCLHCIAKGGMLAAMTVCSAFAECTSDDIAHFIYLDPNSHALCTTQPILEQAGCMTQTEYLSGNCAVRFSMARDSTSRIQCSGYVNGTRRANCNAAASANVVAAQIASGDGPCGNPDDLAAIASVNFTLVDACASVTPHTGGVCLLQVANTSTACQSCMASQMPKVLSACDPCTVDATSQECMDCVADGGVTSAMASCASVTDCSRDDFVNLINMDLNAQYACESASPATHTSCLVNTTLAGLTQSCATLISGATDSTYEKKCIVDCGSNDIQCTNCKAAAAAQAVAAQVTRGEGPCGHPDDLAAIGNANFTLVNACGTDTANYGLSCLIQAANPSDECGFCLTAHLSGAISDCAACPGDETSTDCTQCVARGGLMRAMAFCAASSDAIVYPPYRGGADKTASVSFLALMVTLAIHVVIP